VFVAACPPEIARPAELANSHKIIPYMALCLAERSPEAVAAVSELGSLHPVRVDRHGNSPLGIAEVALNTYNLPPPSVADFSKKSYPS
jgi:hypothetical protein